MLYRMKKGVGPHSMKLKGKNITLRSGDEVRCDPEDIGGALNLKFDALEPPPPEPSPERGLVVESRKDGKCDVINEATGNKINDEPLTPKEAEQMAGSLMPIPPVAPSVPPQEPIVTKTGPGQYHIDKLAPGESVEIPLDSEVDDKKGTVKSKGDTAKKGKKQSDAKR